MKKVFASMALMACSAASLATEQPKNVILVVGDGMGPAYTAAYRNYMDNKDTPQVEKTIFDKLLVGMSSTYSSGTRDDHYDNTYVTDSAASATALSTGKKTYNHAVALDPEDKPLKTVMQHAKAIGKTTGLVVLSQINHATPASFVAHNTYRYNYNPIADHFYDNRVDGKFIADLMFGGGQKYFIRDDRNIVEQFKADGYHYYDDFSQLGSIDKLPVLGLFAPKDMGFAINAKEKYRLRSMVKKALSLMEKSDKGYFLLVEASLVDWCGHSNDIACAMHEMDGLAKTLEYLQDYTNQRSDTLVVATADHNTGGLSIGANGKYQWRPDLVKKVSKTAWAVADEVYNGAHVLKAWMEGVNLPIKPEYVTGIAETRQKAREYVKAEKAKHEAPIPDSVLKGLENDAIEILETYLVKVISEITHTGWTSTGHTGGDVQVFAAGPGKQLFNGHQDNTDIGQNLFKLIK